MTFKVGDRVRVLYTNGANVAKADVLTVYEIGEINGTPLGRKCVQAGYNSECLWSFLPRHLELVETEPNAGNEVTRALASIKARATDAIQYNNEPWVELPWLVDDKFSFENILQLVAALEKAIEQRRRFIATLPAAYRDNNHFMDAEIEALLSSTIKQGEK